MSVKYDTSSKNVIIKFLKSRNRMLVVLAKVKKAKDVVEANNLLSSSEGDEEIWHKRTGHLNHSSLMTLAGRDMVKRLQKITTKEAMCEILNEGKVDSCQYTKQSVWKASKRLDLVHTHLRTNNAYI